MRARICTDWLSLYEGEWTGICTLPEGHEGEHDHVDTMGLCGENDDCRAARGGIWTDNGHAHNH